MPNLKKLQMLQSLSALDAPQQQQQESAARSHQARVATAMQMLGLQQQQQNAGAEQAFRQQQLAQSEQGKAQDYELAKTHYGNLEQAANNRNELEAIQGLGNAQAMGQSGQGYSDFLDRARPERKTAREEAYWKSAGDLYNQHEAGFTELKDHSPLVNQGYFDSARLPVETRQWLLEHLKNQLPTVSPQATGVQVPQGFENDPQIQAMLQQKAASQNQVHEYYKQGGQLDTGIARQKVQDQTSPILSLLKAIGSLYQ